MLRPFRLLAALPLAAMLCACNAIVLNPSGVVAARQADLVVDSTLLMLLVIVPVMALTILFAWRYRHTNKAARYEPDWDHSTQLELVIWAAPLLIIICLGALTWVGTHLLDPYRPLGSLKPAPNDMVTPQSDPMTPHAPQTARKPFRVDVVALDWKWLFIYPDYGVATVNELAAPVNEELEMRITSSSVMNSLYIPALAGMIYAMPAMQTQLHAVMGKTGDYDGFSANYSGAGFSGMHFKFRSLTRADFEQWVSQVKAGDGGALSRSEYLGLERPSENVPVQRYTSVDPGLYEAILNMCVEPGKVCMNEMMARDAMAEHGHEMPPVDPRALEYDKTVRRGGASEAAGTPLAAAH
jgi:cytochrome o ubiquinol oxidase subunit 2